MKLKKIIFCIITVLFILTTLFSAHSADKKEPPKTTGFSKDQQLQQIKPKKPLRIKLHRNAKGEYTWDITGENPDEIVKADNKLKRLLKLE